MKNIKIEKEWDYKGMHCLIVFTSMGHRCGYVGIDKNHFLFGLGYSDNKYLESIEKLINVHGGITFADYYKDATNEDYWYFGFDCGHSGDASDKEQSFKYGLICEKDYLYYKNSKFYNNGIIRSLDYVESEVMRLAEQIPNLKLKNKMVKELYIKEEIK